MPVVMPHRDRNDYSVRHRRQLSPAGTVTAASAANTASLALNPSSETQPFSAYSLATQAVTTSASSSSATVTVASSASSSAIASTANSSSSSGISLGVVIGACFGAFVGVALIVVLAIWYNRRSSVKAAASRKARSPVSPIAESRNANGDNARRKSHLEAGMLPGAPRAWSRVDGDGNNEKWQRMQERKQVMSSSPMEKLGAMFKRTPSTNSGEKDGSSSSFDHDGDITSESMGFSKYHPRLAEELATPPYQRRFLGRIEGTSHASESWDGETIAGNSFLSLRSPRASGAMSPPLVTPKITPAIVSSEPHYWESAEVLHLEKESSQLSSKDTDTLKDPFMEPENIPRRKSSSNPFFNAQEGKLRHNHVSINPFSDPEPPRPFAAAHALHPESQTSIASDHALQSLIAALDVTPEEVHERLRVASMQPSVMSQGSTNMTVDEEDVTSMTAFPLPPTQVPHGDNI